MKQNSDTKNPTPMYFQIQKDIRERIERQEWLSNTFLPSEILLAKEYNVSRVTLRQALNILENDYIIKKIKGKGSLIINRNSHQFVKDLDYSIIHSHQDTSITAKILERTNSKNIPVFFLNKYPELTLLYYHYIERIFYYNNKPIAISYSWINQAIAPNIDKKDLINNSISETLLAKYNITTDSFSDYISICNPTLRELKILDLQLDTPLLAINGIAYTKLNEVIEVSTTYWISNNVTFKINNKEASALSVGRNHLSS